MTYVVNESCIKCKYMDCVRGKPVDCSYEGENILVIHPDECIDCGGLRAQMPGRRDQAGHRALALEKWLALSMPEYAKTARNITIKREAPPDAKEWGWRAGQVQEVLFAGAGRRRTEPTQTDRPRLFKR